MPDRLFVTDLQSVGLVEAGDDPAAQVTLFKSATLLEETPNMEDVLEMTDETVTEVIEETVETVEDDQVNKQADEIAKLNSELETLRKQVAREEELRKEREAADFAAKYEALGDWSDVHKSVDEVTMRLIAEKLDVLNERLQMAGLFKEMGDGDSDGVDVFAKQDAFVKEYKTENPGTSDAKARAEFWRKNPALREEARNI